MIPVLGSLEEMYEQSSIGGRGGEGAGGERRDRWPL